MARLYTNENFPLPAAEALRSLGHDVMTIQESGLSNKSTDDDVVLEFATSRQRALITTNRKHFIRLHRQGVAHCGIIVCTFDPDFKGQAERIHSELQKHTSLKGELIRVNRPPQ